MEVYADVASMTSSDACNKSLTVFVGKLWSRSVKVAYNLLHKLGTKQEPLVRPGDRVSGKKNCPDVFPLNICFHMRLLYQLHGLRSNNLFLFLTLSLYLLNKSGLNLISYLISRIRPPLLCTSTTSVLTS